MPSKYWHSYMKFSSASSCLRTFIPSIHTLSAVVMANWDFPFLMVRTTQCYNTILSRLGTQSIRPRLATMNSQNLLHLGLNPVMRI